MYKRVNIKKRMMSVIEMDGGRESVTSGICRDEMCEDKQMETHLSWTPIYRNFRSKYPLCTFFPMEIIVILTLPSKLSCRTPHSYMFVLN